jgi:hypothetical protein
LLTNIGIVVTAVGLVAPASPATRWCCARAREGFEGGADFFNADGTAPGMAAACSDARGSSYFPSFPVSITRTPAGGVKLNCVSGSAC